MDFSAQCVKKLKRLNEGSVVTVPILDLLLKLANQIRFGATCDPTLL